MKTFWQRVFLVGLDVITTLLAVAAAFALRFDGRPPVQFLVVYVKVLPVILPLRVVIYYAWGLYRHVWAYASIPELLRVVGAVSVDSLVTAGVIFILSHPFPRSVLLISWFLKIGFLGSIRLMLRLRRYWQVVRRTSGTSGEKTLIFGAGDAGAILARELLKHPEAGTTVRGFVDDDPLKQGYFVASKPVLGTRQDLAEIVRQHGITHVIIAMPSASRSVIREVIEASRELGLRLKTMPKLYELVNGQVSISQIRDVQIEDLLGRTEVKLDLEAIAAYLAGERVLVTGAGGSIGSELCRQVARLGPEQLILLGHGENSIYEIDLELRSNHPDLSIHPVIADIRDETRIRQIFERFRPGVVFHAAAHKHVPLMELNPEEALANNVIGTLNVARAADEYGAKRFVLISSDKAVNPTSIMGATKRAAEYVVQTLAHRSSTVFVAVRFGNVLGSRGSVVPLFKRQIAAGGPVTVTDPRMVRYFMTIPEAVQLVIQAASMGRGGEIFVLDMGEPVRIVDLARELIQLSGFEPDVDIPIVYTGVRLGEKLFEELLTAEEGTVATQHDRIFRARGEAVSEPVLGEFLESLRQLAATGQIGNERLRSLVQEVAIKGRPGSVAGVGD